MSDVKITDNTPQVKQEFSRALLRGMWSVGETAARYARELTPVDTARLRNSITHVEDENEKAVYIGTNVEYAIWHEIGTGIYASQGGGRQSPWAFQDKNGDWHYTHGVKARHFLQRAATEHGDEYKRLLESSLKSGD